jgi:Tfp pilus assembly protein PilV
MRGLTIRAASVSVIRSACMRWLLCSSRRTPCRAADSGFALLETFIALVILGFALAGLSMLMLGNMQTGLEARRNTAAGALAQHKLEEIRAAGYGAAANGTTTEASLSETGATTGITPFSRVSTIAAGATAETKNLSISVSWTDQVGAHTVQLNSVLAASP